MPSQRIPAWLSGSPHKNRRGGWANQGPNGYDIHGDGPLSYVVAITHATSPAICLQGRDAAVVKQSQEANGA